MKNKFTNIVLIGMPGSGKSTVGIILAKKLARDFVDTDVIIQSLQKRTLQEIVDSEGHAALRRIEADVLRGLSVRNHIVATGGSAIYSDTAMKHLKSDGIVVFLDVSQDVLERRVSDFSTRGLAKQPDQTFSQLFDERLPLYRKYADITVEFTGQSQENFCADIIKEFESFLENSG